MINILIWLQTISAIAYTSHPGERGSFNYLLYTKKKYKSSWNKSRKVSVYTEERWWNSFHDHSRWSGKRKPFISTMIIVLYVAAPTPSGSEMPLFASSQERRSVGTAWRSRESADLPSSILTTIYPHLTTPCTPSASSMWLALICHSAIRPPNCGRCGCNHRFFTHILQLHRNIHANLKTSPTRTISRLDHWRKIVN